jgi:hypothetical protein
MDSSGTPFVLAVRSARKLIWWGLLNAWSRWSACRPAEELKDDAPDRPGQRCQVASLAVSLQFGQELDVHGVAVKRGRLPLAGVHAAKPMHVRTQNFGTYFGQHSCITSK